MFRRVIVRALNVRRERIFDAFVVFVTASFAVGETKRKGGVRIDVGTVDLEPRLRDLGVFLTLNLFDFLLAFPRLGRNNCLRR